MANPNADLEQAVLSMVRRFSIAPDRWVTLGPEAQAGARNIVTRAVGQERGQEVDVDDAMWSRVIDMIMKQGDADV
jgi:hypothetical protein